MIWDRQKTLAVLSNFYIYTIPSISIFSELYNIRILEDELQDQTIRSQFIETDLLPRTGLKADIDNLIARLSSDFFTRLIADSKFHVKDSLDYDQFSYEVDFALEQLDNLEQILAEISETNQKDVSVENFSPNFIAALNDRENEIITSDAEDSVSDTFFDSPIDTRFELSDTPIE
jgi:hypothetical protein